jgi:hypothetical protein
MLPVVGDSFATDRLSAPFTIPFSPYRDVPLRLSLPQYA